MIASFNVLVNLAAALWGYEVGPIINVTVNFTSSTTILTPSGQSIFKRDQPTNNMCAFVESYIFAVNAETLLTSLMSSFIKLQELMQVYTNLHSLPES